MPSSLLVQGQPSVQTRAHRTPRAPSRPWRRLEDCQDLLQADLVVDDAIAELQVWVFGRRTSRDGRTHARCRHRRALVDVLGKR